MMSAMSRAVCSLLQLDNLTIPDRDDREALLAAVSASSWMRFAVGLNPDEECTDEAGITAAAQEFAQHWDIWMAYRTCVIELRPPGGRAVRFCIDPAVPGSPPSDFPASTFAVITAWNPGSGEPR